MTIREKHRKAAEQVAADALNEIWGGDTHDGGAWVAESHEARMIASAFRAAGLVVGEPTDEQIELISEAEWRVGRRNVHPVNDPSLAGAFSSLTEWELLCKLLDYLAAGVTTPATSEIESKPPICITSDGQIESKPAIAVEVDEAKLAGVINRALDAWQGDERSEVFVARAVAEWLRGDGR